MKKATLKSLVSFLDNLDVDVRSGIEDELAELKLELNKGAEKAQANRDLYASVKDTILGGLSDTPVTIAELYEEIKGDLPEGFGKAKVQHALTRMWVDEVVKHEGKVNTYTRA